MRFGRHVRKSAVAVVVEKVVVGRMPGLLQRPGRAVHQIDVRIAVVVIVKERGAFSIHVDQEIGDLVSASDLEGSEPRFFGDIGKSGKRFLFVFGAPYECVRRPEQDDAPEQQSGYLAGPGSVNRERAAGRPVLPHTPGRR